MRKWFTKEYWNQPTTPDLFWVLLLIMLGAFFFGVYKLIEVVTRP